MRHFSFVRVWKKHFSNMRIQVHSVVSSIWRFFGDLHLCRSWQITVSIQTRLCCQIVLYSLQDHRCKNLFCWAIFYGISRELRVCASEEIGLWLASRSPMKSTGHGICTYSLRHAKMLSISRVDCRIPPQTLSVKSSLMWAATMSSSRILIVRATRAHVKDSGKSFRDEDIDVVLSEILREMRDSSFNISSRCPRFREDRLCLSHRGMLLRWKFMSSLLQEILLSTVRSHGFLLRNSWMKHQ